MNTHKGEEERRKTMCAWKTSVDVADAWHAGEGKAAMEAAPDAQAALRRGNKRMEAVAGRVWRQNRRPEPWKSKIKKWQKRGL